MIILDNLSYRYKQSARDSLARISIRQPANEILGVVGSSQAGKTTLAYAVAGLLQKHFPGGRQEGTISIQLDERHGEKLSTGFVFQDPSLQLSGITQTVEEEIAFSLEQFGVPPEVILDRVEEQIELYRLHGLRNRHPKTLSGGETTLLACACETAKLPDLFILDEPTQSLDSRNIQRLIEILVRIRESTTVILIEQHIASAFQLCDKILFLEDGRQRFYGSPRALLDAKLDLSSLVIPEWVEAQLTLGRRDATLTYKETVRWLKKIRSSR